MINEAGWCNEKSLEEHFSHPVEISTLMGFHLSKRFESLTLTDKQKMGSRAAKAQHLHAIDFFCRSAEAGKKLRIINCTKFSIFEEFERRVGEKSQLRPAFSPFFIFCFDLRALTRPTGRWELIAKTTHRALIQFREFEETFPTTQRAVKKGKKSSRCAYRCKNFAHSIKVAFKSFRTSLNTRGFSLLPALVHAGNYGNDLPNEHEQARRLKMSENNLSKINYASEIIIKP